MTRRALQVLAATTASISLGITAGCATARPSATKSTTAVSSVPSSVSGASQRPLRVVHEAQFPLPKKGEVGVTRVADTGVALATGSKDHQRILWYGVHAKHSRALARLSAGWWIDNVAVSNSWVVWVEKDLSQETDYGAPVSWRIYAHNLESGKTRLLRRSRAKSALAPWVSLSGTTLITAVYQGTAAGTSNLWKQRLPTGHRHLFAPSVHSGTGLATGHGVVIPITTAPRSNHPRTDLYVYDGRHRSRLTHTGDIGTVDYADHFLVWTRTNIDHHDTVVAQRWPGGKPHALFTQDDAEARPGDGFLSDYQATPGGEVPVVFDLAAPSKFTALPMPRNETMLDRPSVGGHNIAWTVSPNGNYEGPNRRLVVATITH